MAIYDLCQESLNGSVVEQDKINQILTAVKVPIDHPLFYPRVFALVAKQREQKSKKSNKNGDALLQIVTDEFEVLSRRLDRSGIQESCSVRNVIRTRQLAEALIDEKGEILFARLPPLITHLKNHLYSLGPSRQYDAKRQEHLLKVLQLLKNQKRIHLLLKKFSRPLTNKWAEELIRQTLQLPTGTVVTDAHTRRAVLSAWLCTLRQNVGSCFATAPAEIIQGEQPEQFLQDLLDLISTGTLKRTFGGLENAVPLSASWGSGDLKKPLVLRHSSKGVVPEVWHSPGLIAAFEAAGLLKPEDSLVKKVGQLEEWIKLLFLKGHSYPYIILTAEEIIRKVLLHSLKITEADLKEDENRPRGMISSQLMIHSTPSAKRAGGIAERCKQFLQLFEIAKNMFKSLADNGLLKAWEFTIASYSDTKYEFSRWNFYASLGLQTNEPGGLGQCIHQIIQQKLDQANRKVQDIQYEYEMVYTQVKTLEARMRTTSTEKELQWLKIDYQSRINEFHFLEEQRNEAQNQASALVNLYETLYKLYVDLFKDYFQEIYDADMQEVTTGPFDDSPAGFRLLYKHGRSNSSQWTLIKNQHDFIDALISFFVATEHQIRHDLDEKKIEKDLAEVITAMINHVKTREFLESAFHRMAAAHRAPMIKDPLDHLDQIEKKPWVYTSGGTMNTLVSCYYRIEDKPKEVEKWVENEMELLVFIADTLKQIPPRFLEPYHKGMRESLLMQSPTHAFLLLPMASPFKEAWMNEAFTYTYIRDSFIRPAEIFVENLLLNNDMLRYLIQKIGEKIPENFQPRFQTVFRNIEGPLNPIFFREHVVDVLESDRGLRYNSGPIIPAEEIDSLLFSHLPFFPAADLKERAGRLFKLLPGLTEEKISQMMKLFDQIPSAILERPVLGAKDLKDACKSLLCLNEMSTTAAFDYHLHISRAAQQLGFSLPAPLIFADTNWVKDLFGFVLSPGTGRLELWRVDYTGSNGYPMSSWKQWVNGSRSDLRWGIYVKPFEYGQS